MSTRKFALLILLLLLAAGLGCARKSASLVWQPREGESYSYHVDDEARADNTTLEAGGKKTTLPADKPIRNQTSYDLTLTVLSIEGDTVSVRYAVSNMEIRNGVPAPSSTPVRPFSFTVKLDRRTGEVLAVPTSEIPQPPGYIFRYLVSESFAPLPGQANLATWRYQQLIRGLAIPSDATVPVTAETLPQVQPDGRQVVREKLGGGGPFSLSLNFESGSVSTDKGQTKIEGIKEVDAASGWLLYSETTTTTNLDDVNRDKSGKVTLTMDADLTIKTTVTRK